MPVYNGECYITQALNSVLGQTYPNQEILVINDASTDLTRQILDAFCMQDNRIRVIDNPQRLRVVKSLNIGLKHARGDLIARIDADDIWMPQKLELQVKAFKEDMDLYLLGTAKDIIDESGRLISQKNYFPYYSDTDIKRNIHKANLFTHSSVMFRRSMIERFGFYDEDFLNSEDYEYWLKVTNKVKVGILNKPLVRYRLHSQSVTSLRIQQQMYYSIKARFRYAKHYSIRGFFSKYFLKEVLQLLLPIQIDQLATSIRSSIYRLKKRF
jgi:glycosyltransferase involved in cell wall biosynthesis